MIALTGTSTRKFRSQSTTNAEQPGTLKSEVQRLKLDIGSTQFGVKISVSASGVRLIIQTYTFLTARVHAIFDIQKQWCLS